jgi:hypothetical protein
MLSSKGFTVLRKNAVICPQCVSLTLKKRRDMSSEGSLPLEKNVI